MANPSKAKGTRAETRVASYLTTHGLPTSRRALAGSSDEGDLRMTLPDGSEMTVEVKAGKQTASYSRRQLEAWKRQTEVESFNAGCPGILVIARYRRSLFDAEVWIPTEEWGRAGWTMVYLDDYAEEIGG